MKKIFLLTLLAIGLVYSTAFGQLPQNHQYQVVLRNYMATLNEKDFEVELARVTLDPSYFSSNEELYHAYLSFGNSQFFIDAKGIRVDARYFTLDAIEEGGNVNMTVGRNWGFMPIVATAAWAAWDYPGNPHYNSRAVKLRAFVAAAVDMMMQDQDHARGNNRRSDFLGQQLIRWAFVYGVVKDILPQNVRKAYETGLIRMFEKLEKWGPVGIHADMDMPAMVGMLYTAKFVESKDLTQRAHDYIDLLLNEYYHEAGYIDHGGAYDGGYNGISLYFINWAVQISEYPPLIKVLREMSKLKAYMTLPDPDGFWASPFHSNPSSTTGAARDLWEMHYRDTGIAYYSDANVYLVFAPSPSEMHNLLNAYLERMHDPDYLALTTPSNDSPGTWGHSHWLDERHINLSALYYNKGLYDKLRSLQNSNSPLTKPPFSREKNFTKNFDDKFLSAKRDTYGTILFSDRLSWWTEEGATNDFNGFGGGNISAFWTPSTGTVILGAISQSGHSGGLGSKDWRIWPIHALTGVTASGNIFSSAIQRYPEAVYELNRNIPRVTITGDLSSIYSDPTKSLTEKVTYKRIFEIHDNGLRVTTSVIDGCNEKVAKLFEIIPVYRLTGARQEPSARTEIAFEINGSWQPPSTNFEQMSRVRLNRFNGTVYIEFSEPVRAKLSPQDFDQKPGTEYGVRTRNIMIDMLGSENSLCGQSVTYFIRSSKAPPYNGGGGDDTPIDTTSPTVEVSHSPNTPDITQKIIFTATASDASNIKKLSIFVDEDLKKTCRESSTCKIKLGPLNSGKHTYHARAVDGSSRTNKNSSKKKTFNVSRVPPPNSSPANVTVKLKKQTNFLKANVDNVSDPDGDQVYLVYDWRVDGKSLAVVNLPFDINSVNDTKTNADENGNFKNYTTHKNPVHVGNGKASPGWIKKGKKGGALVFDGKNDYVRVSTGNSIDNLQKFTIEVWIKHDNWGEEWATIISKPFYTDSWKDPWAVFKLSRKSNTDHLNLQITVGKNKAVSLQSEQEIPANKWTHIAATYNGKDLKLYINGKLDQTLSVNKPLVTRANTDIFIAKNSKGTTDSEQYRGVMDEIRIFNVALSQKQIRQHYLGNHDKMLLGQLNKGARWKVAVTANDTKAYAGQPALSNTVTISDRSSQFKANKNSLAQNYPNPFHDKTTIQYNLNKPQKISLKVYDTTGRLIKKIYDGKRSAGMHKVTFDGSNLASGVYLVVLILEEGIITRKMTLIH